MGHRWRHVMFSCSGWTCPVLLVGLVSTSPAPAQSSPAAIAEGDVIHALGETSDPLTLSICVETALAANSTLAQERERLAELEGQVIQARSEGFPRIEVEGNWLRNRDPSFALDESFAGGDGGLGTLFDPLYDAVGLDPPDLGGSSFIPAPQDIPAQSFWRAWVDTYWELHPTRWLRAVSAAKKGLQRQEIVVTDAQNRTVEQVITAFHGVVLAAGQLHAIEAEIGARQEFLEVTRRRFLLDLATPLDTLQAAVSLANLQPEKRRRQTGLRKAGQDLNVLLGRDPLTPVSVRAEFPIEDDDVSPRAATALARRRPDVRQQQLFSELLRIQRSAQKANNHPYLTLEGSYGYVGRDLDTIADDGHDFWRTSVTLTWPLWDGQVVKGQVQQTEASLRRSEHALDDQRRRAEAEVLQALDDLEVARTDLAAADLNMARAEQAFSQVGLRYELGKADQLDVLNAQSERFAARSNLLRARHQVLAVTATLKRAMGMSPLEPLARTLESYRSLESSP